MQQTCFFQSDIEEKRFADVTKVNKTTKALSSITRDEFKQCFEKWNERLYISLLMQVEITLKGVKALRRDIGRQLSVGGIFPKLDNWNHRRSNTGKITAGVSWLICSFRMGS
ncbi:hypothetical protein TNIN_486931 [Trichonephila inaurata madagascariensis]|uniref:Uncharacterized protein n=1 Tax=Trichonephila inaurata madagascariensis TaxID=2747483 RepID=A0A8X7BMU5_9ARAC|nr:hypothetical protein TNIN_486931 [Trichonephila inaurata madagascariensis]